MSTETYTSTGKELVLELAAAMHSHGRMFSKSKSSELRLLLGMTKTTPEKALRELSDFLAQGNRFQGEIPVHPDKSPRNCLTVFKMLINIAATYVVYSFSNFLDASKNGTPFGKDSPTWKRARGAMDVLDALIEVDKHSSVIEQVHFDKLIETVPVMLDLMDCRSKITNWLAKG